MKVCELIEALECFDPGMEVKMVYQPHWPMQVTIDDVQEAEGKVYVIQRWPGNDYAPDGLYDI